MRVDIRVSPEILLGLDVLAEARGTSRSGVVEALVREALESKPKKKGTR